VNKSESKFELLCQYKSINGNASVPESYETKEGVKLGEWVVTQRSRQNRMPTSRISIPVSISFDWDRIMNEWENKFEILCQYKSINGDANVPNSYVTTEGVKLGTWVSSQRGLHRKNQLSTTRISLFDSISFEWDPIANEWKNKFMLLQKYKSNNGNTNVVQSHVTKEGVKIGTWVNTQRCLHRKNQLSTTRISMLDSISFDWDLLIKKREKLQKPKVRSPVMDKFSNEWENKFESLQQYKSINGNTNVPSSHSTTEGVKLGAWVIAQRCIHRRNQLLPNRISMLDSISFDWDPTVNEWENKFELLRRYKAINGNTSLPENYVTTDGVRLGEWVINQRAQKNRMPITQINMLNSISFDWEITVNEWENKFELLRHYESINGNTNVPKSYVTNEGARLGDWVINQRTKKNLMPMTRISMLDSISFDWDPIANEWENKFELLRQYKLINDNTNVPKNYVTKDGVKLGIWTDTLRAQKNRISAYQISVLDSISFDWDPYANEWLNKFELLQQYKLINGNTNVPSSHSTTEGVKLGAWVNTQRIIHRRNQLLPTRISMLDSISFDWDPTVNKWESKFELLRQYKAIIGNTSLPENYVTTDGVKLGIWVDNQRAQKNRMSAYRIRMLDSISFDWDPYANEWGNKFELLQQYKSINGNTNVPSSHITTEGVKLGTWVNSQRGLYRRNQLLPTRISMLVSISFEWDPTVNEWQNKFELLRQYKSINENTNVPQSHVTTDGVKLGTWVSTQRCLHRKTQLLPTRISMLDSISFDWDPLMKKREKLQKSKV